MPSFILLIFFPTLFRRATELAVQVFSALPFRRHVCYLAALTRTLESGIKIIALAPLLGLCKTIFLHLTSTSLSPCLAAPRETSGRGTADRKEAKVGNSRTMT